jgi:hypothetical protein
MKLLLLIVMLVAPVQQTTPSMNFSPESDKFIEATKIYQTIWKSEGSKMITALEEASGLRFIDKEIAVVVFEGPSESGYREKPMKLRASYPEDVKKATIVHELGHRLNHAIRNRPIGIDEHRILFLYLYETWTKLYGKDFADRMVSIEKGRKGLYDYESAWNWALAMTEAERTAKLREIVKNN